LRLRHFSRRSELWLYHSLEMGKWVLAIIVFVVAAVLGAMAANKLRGGDAVVLQAASATVTPGWKRHSSSNAGFQIDLPVEFTTIDPKDPKLRDAIAEVSKQNPEAERLLMQVIGTGGFVFWAFDFQNMAGSFAKNLNAIREVKRSDLPAPGANLEPYRDAIAKSLPSNGKLVGISAVKLPVGNVLQTVMEFTLQNENGTVKTCSYGYAVIDDDSQLTMTFTCLKIDADAFKPIADRAMETFRLID